MIDDSKTVGRRERRALAQKTKNISWEWWEHS